MRRHAGSKPPTPWILRRSPRRARRGEAEIRSAPSRGESTSGPCREPRSHDRECGLRRAARTSTRSPRLRSPTCPPCVCPDSTRSPCPSGRWRNAPGSWRSTIRSAPGVRGCVEASALEPRLAIAVREVEAEDLHRASLGRHVARVVDEQVDAVLRQRTRHDVGRLVIVVAVAREDLARQRPQRRQRVEQEVRVALRLHREKVAGEEHEVRLRRHRALGDSPEARDGHERTEVRVGDLHDAERTGDPLVASRMGAELGDCGRARGTRDHEVDVLVLRRERLAHSDRRERIRDPAPQGCPPNAATSAHGRASKVPATKNADGQLTRSR